MYLFLAALSLHSFAHVFSSFGEQGSLFVEVHRLLIVVTSHCLAQVLGMRASVFAARRLISCCLWALECKLSNWGSWA